MPLKKIATTPSMSTSRRLSVLQNVKEVCSSQVVLQGDSDFQGPRYWVFIESPEIFNDAWNSKMPVVLLCRNMQMVNSYVEVLRLLIESLN